MAGAQNGPPFWQRWCDVFNLTAHTQQNKHTMLIQYLTADPDGSLEDPWGGGRGCSSVCFPNLILFAAADNFRYVIRLLQMG